MILLWVMCYNPTVWATIRHVPQDYPTIQAAFDVLSGNDTVWVDSGLYAEALIAPPLRFTLLGNVEPDTGAYRRPTIDPSSLPESDTLACLMLPVGCSASIERFAFVNHAAMFPRPDTGNYPGGISYFTSDSITIRECLFDSVYGGLVYPTPTATADLTVEHCLFQNMTNGCVATRGSLQMSDCLIRGHNYAGVGTRYSSIIERCHFEGDCDTEWLGVYRWDNIVRDCIFGPGTCQWHPLYIYSWGSNRVTRNVFQEIGLGESLMYVTLHEGDPVVIDSNVFEDGYMFIYQSAPIIIYEEPEAIGSVEVHISDDWFLRNQGAVPGVEVPKLFSIYTAICPTFLERNRFIANTPLEAPVYMVDTAASIHRLSDNAFIHNGDAVYSNYGTLEASSNYWGDSTGPYHAGQNPNGRGDSIQGSVDFTPWYPDTSFLMSVPGLGKPLPQAFVFEAYPNPFNNTVHLRLIPNDIQIVKVELFDMLGRKVKEIWHGPLAFQKDIEFDASTLASGIYFARVTNTIFNRPLATAKLVLLK